MSYAEDRNLDVTNPAPRCPVVLVLDVSGSMDGEPLRELNAGVQQFFRETSDDETASMSVEAEVITYGDEVRVAVPFSPIHEAVVPTLESSGWTPMGEALQLASKELAARRRLYKNQGIASYKPWVILMTDGMPNDDWQKAAEEMKALGEERKITYIGIGIGEDADFDTLRAILPEHPGPVKLKGLCFKEFFRWLSDSLRSVSASSVAEQDNITLGTVNSWADLAGTEEA